MENRDRLVLVEIGAPVLEAKDLYRFFHAGDEETLALKGVCLTVESGEVVAVTGPSGSGKSTLLQCLAGIDEPDGGMVWVAGRALSRRPETERTAIRALHIGMLFQSGNLLEHLTLMQNLALVIRLTGKAGKSTRSMLDEPRQPPEAGWPPSEDLLTDLGLSGRAYARPSELSGGEAARAGLAVALANNPSLLLADEPTGEVDAVAEAGVLDLFRAKARAGVAVVVVTHSPAVAAFADRTIALEDGRVVS